MTDDKSPPASQVSSETPANFQAAADAVSNNAQNRLAVTDDAETNLWSGGYSPQAMIGTWILGGLATLVVFIMAGMFLTEYFLGALLVILAAWALAGGVYAYRRLGVYYELTTQRFIHQSGLLSRRTDRIEVIDIDDVSVKQGPVERVFGTGTILIQSSDNSHPKLEMPGIAQAKQVATLIDDTRRKERRRRSLHIEAI